MANAKLTQAVSTEDIREVATMAYDIWQEHYATVLTQEQISYMLDKFQSAEAISNAIAGEGYEYYLIKVDGRTVGYVGINRDYPAGKLYLSKLYLFKEERSKGYAREVMDFLIDMAKKDGSKSIWLSVNKDNPSVSVYKKMGFVETNSEVRDIGDGFYMDDYIMELTV